MTDTDTDTDSKAFVYCIPFQYKEQSELAKRHCFGDCGKICIGMIDTGDDVAGLCAPCKEKSCPYEKGVIGPIGTAQSDGAILYIRALREKQPQTEGL